MSRVYFYSLLVQLDGLIIVLFLLGNPSLFDIKKSGIRETLKTTIIGLDSFFGFAHLVKAVTL